jgi:AhpD family alkylhydroperoxidase
MDYAENSKDTLVHLYAGYKTFDESPLAADLKALIELRVSQMNGCVYCCNLHTNEAVKLGVSKNKIESLSEFSLSSLFSDAEKEALQWAESLTKLDGNKKFGFENTGLSKYFSERQIADITICIALMNTFNRLAISFQVVSANVLPLTEQLSKMRHFLFLMKLPISLIPSQKV